ncbi:MAG: tRNA (adenosine(37)-N6)-dimethylallyltransferase MiaA [Gammaproteobacteria bacterium]|nr:tRNA (adenosine(37)-N6)-dimethylallyltransferase MiaA [Gammaproteobacteria bacterium]
MPEPDIIFLMGPTASGKSALALEIARRLPVEIISVDSALVYRDMDIGTAKPPADIRSQVPHHLIDICDPAEVYSAGRFRTDARALIEQISARQRVPLLVGGTGLYFRSLQRGIARLPVADAGIRAQLEADAAAHGWAVLHARLRAVDPEAAARIHPADPQRIQRALEVYLLTGRALSSHLADRNADPLDNRVHKFVLNFSDRRRLHDRIETRFHRMLEAGLLDEVRALYRRGDLTCSHPSMRLVGYRQCWQHLAGEIPFSRLPEKGIAATRQLARRQLTWLRQEPGATWLDPSSADLAGKVLKSLQLAPIQGA